MYSKGFHIPMLNTSKPGFLISMVYLSFTSNDPSISLPTMSFSCRDSSTRSHLQFGGFLITHIWPIVGITSC